MHSGRHKPLPDAHFARILHAGKSAPDPSRGRRSCRFHKVLEPQNLQHPDWVGHPHPADLRHKNGEHACGSWLKMKDRFWWRCWFWFKQQNFNKSAQLGVHSSGQICNPCTSKLRTEMLCHGFSEDHAFIHSDFACKSIPRLTDYPATSFGQLVCWQIQNKISKPDVGQSTSDDQAFIHSDFACLQIHP